MRGHLIQGPSLACHFGDLTVGAHVPSSAYPHTGLPSCPAPGHASCFPHLYPHLQNALPCSGCPLTPLGWGQAAQANRSSLGEWGVIAVPTALSTLSASHWSGLLPPPTLAHPPRLMPLISTACPMGSCMEEGPTISMAGVAVCPLSPMHQAWPLPLQGHNKL